MSPGRRRRELQYSMRVLEDRRGHVVHALYRPVYHRSPHKVSRSADAHRPHTAAVFMAPFVQCERVEQVEREATRCPSLERHVASNTRCKPHSCHTSQPLVPFAAGPGYILSRQKSKHDVTKNAWSPEPTPEEEQQQRLQAEAERQVLVVRLQQQISDLTFSLEEERLNHKQTKQRAEEYLRDRLEQLNTQHREHTRQVQAKHREESQKHKTQLDTEFTEFQTKQEDQIRHLARQVEVLQASFEACKSGLQDDMQNRFVAMETDLKAQCQKAVQAATQDLKSQLTRDKAADRTEAVKEQRRLLESLRKEHKKDMDNVRRKYSKEASDMERLKKTTTELEHVRHEVRDMQGKYDVSSEKLSSATRTLTDMKVRLMDFESRFQDKVTEVKDKYKHKLHDLSLQNSQLRQLYDDKCGQLFDQQTHTHTRTMLQLKSAKAAMQSYLQSQQNSTTTKTTSDSNPRPSSAAAIAERSQSAPATPRERKMVQLSAVETELLNCL